MALILFLQKKWNFNLRGCSPFNLIHKRDSRRLVSDQRHQENQPPAKQQIPPILILDQQLF